MTNVDIEQVEKDLISWNGRIKDNQNVLASLLGERKALLNTLKEEYDISSEEKLHKAIDELTLEKIAKAEKIKKLYSNINEIVEEQVAAGRW